MAAHRKNRRVRCVEMEIDVKDALWAGVRELARRRKKSPSVYIEQAVRARLAAEEAREMIKRDRVPPRFRR